GLPRRVERELSRSRRRLRAEREVRGRGGEDQGGCRRGREDAAPVFFLHADLPYRRPPPRNPPPPRMPPMLDEPPEPAARFQLPPCEDPPNAALDRFPGATSRPPPRLPLFPPKLSPCRVLPPYRDAVALSRYGVPPRCLGLCCQLLPA